MSETLTIETVNAITVDIGDSPPTLTAETINALTLEIAPFDTTQANAVQIRGKAIVATAPTGGQVLAYNGTQYAPTSMGGRSVTLYATIEAALAALAAAEAVLILPHGWTGEVAANLTIPANVALDPRGGIIVPASGVNIHFAGEILETPFQFIDLSEGGTFTLAAGVLRDNRLHSYHVGMVADGDEFDNFAIMEAATDALEGAGGGEFWLASHPRDTYYGLYADSPNVLKRHVTVRGDGGFVHLHNYREVTDLFGDLCAFRAGWQHQRHQELFTYTPINNISEGDDFFTCTTPAHASRFVEGSLVGIASTTSSAPGNNDAPGEPVYLKFYEVVSDGNTGTGVVQLDRGIDDAADANLGGARAYNPNEGVALVDSSDTRTAFIARDAKFCGCHVSSTHSANLRGATYNCHVEFTVIGDGLEMGSRHLMGANTIARSYWKAKGAYANRVLECGYGSHDSTIVIGDTYFSPLTDAETGEVMLSIAGSARGMRVVVEGDINAGTHNHKDLIRIAGKGNSLEIKGRITSLHSTGGVGWAFGTSEPNQAAGDNTIFGTGSIHAGYYDAEDPAAPYLRVFGVFGSRKGATQLRDTVRGIRVYGRPLTGLMFTKAYDARVEGVFLEHGRVVFHSTAENCQVIGSHFSGRVNGLGAYKNYVSDNRSPRATACIAGAIRNGGRVTPIVSTTANNVIGRGTYVAGALLTGDRISVTITGVKTGTGESTIALRDAEADGSNAGTLTSVVFSTAETGEFSIHGTIVVMGQTSYVFYVIRVSENGVIQTVAPISRTVTSMATAGRMLTLEAWNEAASTGKVTFYDIRIEPDIRGFATSGAEKAGLVAQGTTTPPDEPSSEVPTLVHHADFSALGLANGANITTAGDLVPWTPIGTAWTYGTEENGLNGLGCAVTNGSGLYTLGTGNVGNTGLFAESVERFTIVVVAKLIPNLTLQAIIARARTSINADKTLFYTLGTTNLLKARVRGEIEDGTAGDSDVHIHMITWDGLLTRRYIDNDLENPVEITAGAAAEEVLAHITLGGWMLNGVTPTNVIASGTKFGETRIYEGAMEGDYTDARYELFEILAEKWGITL